MFQLQNRKVDNFGTGVFSQATKNLYFLWTGYIDRKFDSLQD